MRRRLLGSALLLASAAALGPSACAMEAEDLWGAGLPESAVLDAPATPNGVVLSLGPAAWEAASSKVTKALGVALPDGLMFDGEASLGEGSVSELVVVSWMGAKLLPTSVDLSVDPLGLSVALSAALEPLTLSVSIDGEEACSLDLDLEHAILGGRLSLTRTKEGQIQASPLVDASSLSAEEVSFDVSGCPLPAGDVFSLTEPPGELLLGIVASAAMEGLGAALADAVPTALGLDLATATSLSWGGDGMGAGALDVLIRASESEASKWWQLVDHSLVVPYAITLEATHHPCMPEAAAAPMPTAPVPAVEDDAAVLLSTGLVAHAARSLWHAGAFCRERATAGMVWSAEELAPLWPALDVLAPGAELSLRLWPLEPPGLAFDNAGEDVHVRLTTGLMKVELYGDVEGTWVRLASLELALEVGTHLSVDSAGRIWLEPKTVELAGFSASSGFLPAPASELASALAAPLAQDLVAATPLASVPTSPLGVPTHARVDEAYLVFHAPPPVEP